MKKLILSLAIVSSFALSLKANATTTICLDDIVAGGGSSMCDCSEPNEIYKSVPGQCGIKPTGICTADIQAGDEGPAACDCPADYPVYIQKVGLCFPKK